MADVAMKNNEQLVLDYLATLIEDIRPYRNYLNYSVPSNDRLMIRFTGTVPLDDAFWYNHWGSLKYFITFLLTKYKVKVYNTVEESNMSVLIDLGDIFDLIKDTSDV